MLDEESYVSLRTFRRTGVGVDTPVWAAPAGGHLYVFSAGEAGKVKRIRNNDAIQMAPCNATGKLHGDWVDGTAALVTSADEIATALDALRRKYGWQMRLADWGSKLTGKFDKRAYLRVTIPGQGEASLSENGD